ncbi:MAG: transcriptional repressor, partial [Bartonella sp.]|nr:transcriptional repressor [Bartonella sp.]
IQEKTIAYDIKQMTQKNGFQAHKSTIEVKGTCNKCTTK